MLDPRHGVKVCSYPNVRFLGRGRVRLYYSHVCFCGSHHVVVVYESMQSLRFSESNLIVGDPGVGL